METPVKIWDATGVRARDEPDHVPFRLYFGITYLAIGLTILLYMGNR